MLPSAFGRLVDDEVAALLAPLVEQLAKSKTMPPRSSSRHTSVRLRSEPLSHCRRTGRPFSNVFRAQMGAVLGRSAVR